MIGPDEFSYVIDSSGQQRLVALASVGSLATEGGSHSPTGVAQELESGVPMRCTVSVDGRPASGPLLALVIVYSTERYAPRPKKVTFRQVPIG